MKQIVPWHSDQLIQNAEWSLFQFCGMLQKVGSSFSLFLMRQEQAHNAFPFYRSIHHFRKGKLPAFALMNKYEKR